MDPALYWSILIAANIPLYLGAGWVMFRTWSGFGEAIRYWFTPDLWSWARDEWGADMLAELKLFIFFGVCAGVVWLEHIGIQKLLGGP